jgi:Flp pilus assembly protein TadG
VATVELAILLPVLMFLFVVAIDYARIFYAAVTIQNCARNGAYYVSNYPNSSYLYNDIYGYTNTDQAVMSDASNLIDPNDSSTKPTYTVSYDTSPNGPFTNTSPTTNCYVQVTVTWTFHSITNFPGVPSQVTFSRSSVMKVAPAMPTFPT